MTTKKIPWRVYDLDSKHPDHLLEIPMDHEGYYLDCEGNRIAFNGNRELKPAHVKLALNQYHVEEIYKCATDLHYFIFNYCKVLTKQGWRTPDLRDYQEEYLINTLNHNRITLLAGRQLGKTVGSSLKFVWSLNFAPDVSIGMCANVEKGANEVLHKMKQIFNKLPIWLQQGVTKWNVKSVYLENGSKAITSATNGDAFRGFSFVGGTDLINEGISHSTLYIDECVAYDTKIIIKYLDTLETQIISIGDFNKLYNKEKSTDRFNVLTPSGWSSFSGIKKTIRKDGIILTFDDNTKLQCTPEHLVRSNGKFIKAIDSLGCEIDAIRTPKRVLTVSSNIKEDKEYFDLLNVEQGHQYFTDFIVSHNCAFIDNWKDFADSVLPTVSSDPNANIIITSTPNGMNHYYELVKNARLKKSEYFLQETAWNCLPERNEEWKQKIIATNGLAYFEQNYGCKFIGSSKTLLEAKSLEALISKEPIEMTSTFKMYQKPHKNAKYVLLCDLASGTQGDYTVVQVIKILKGRFEQVGVFHANTIPLLSMPAIINQLGIQYNNAFILFELNYGAEVPARMYNEYEYENLLTIAKTQNDQVLMGYKGQFQLGLNMTQKVKESSLISLKTLIDSGKLLIHDHDTINEFYNFVMKPNGSFSAETGYHDDLVMGLNLLGWLVMQDTFKEITEYDFISDYEETKAEELSDLLPVNMFADSDSMDDW